MRRGVSACNVVDFPARIGLAVISGCAYRLKNFVQWNSICRPRRGVAGCAGAKMAALFADRSGISGAGFSCFCRSIRRAGRREEGKVAKPAVRATIRVPDRAISKHPYGTMTYDEYSITVACYLCNTHPKTVCRVPFRVVPLLRVHGASVIVKLRRRGASRGRPVLGGSLKSLAFMRECPKARSG
jgi:hypothetical protein